MRDQHGDHQDAEEGFHAWSRIGSNPARIRFAFLTLLTTAVTLLLAHGGVCSLGNGNGERGNLRQAQAEEFARGSEDARCRWARAASLRWRDSTASVSRERYDSERQFLLDNRTHDGRPVTKCSRLSMLSDGGWCW